MAYVLSSISGNLISAASAGYAPTNGSDVSAIASAYQVVSATATQLNAGTAYVTSINETQLSAARAGNAANATQATSAWYDGTGRLISSLPDSAAVSGIASAYAESAASGKEDAITYGYDTGNAISSINGSALAGGGGGGVVTATASGKYAATGLILPIYTTGVSSVNNSSLIAAYAGMAVNDTNGSSISSCISKVYNNSATWNKAGSISSIASSYADSAASSKLDKSASSDFYSTSNPSGFITGVNLSDYATTAYVDSSVSGKQDTLTFDYTTINKISGINGSAIYTGPSVPTVTTGAWYTAYAQSSRVVSAINGNGLYAQYSLSANSSTYAASARVAASAWTAESDVNGNSISACIDTVSANSATWGAGGVDSATVSAIASSYVESGVSSKLDESATADFYSTSNPSGFLTGVDLSNYATTAYVDSSVSGKLDSTAFNSGDFYSTSNPSGFITGVDLDGYATTSYVDSSVSSKADSSALSSYALSADVSGTVDLVSTQSANWGGSALQLSAGDGISLTLSGNVLIIATAGV